MSIAAMGRTLQRAGLTRKKVLHPDRAGASGRPGKAPSVPSRDRRSSPERSRLSRRIGLHIAMTVSYGRAPAGVRVADSKPANWGKNRTVVGAIKNDRIGCHRTFAGAMNKPRFIDFIRHVLCPRLSPGAVLVLDNLRAHHAPEVCEAVEAAGAHVLYLPPYAPDLNPIELCWSFAKACLRRLAQRTESGLRKGINNTMLRVRTDQLRGWFNHCGFGQRKRSAPCCSAGESSLVRMGRS